MTGGAGIAESVYSVNSSLASVSARLAVFTLFEVT